MSGPKGRADLMQEPAQDLGPPELPDAVGSLPVAFWTWALLLASLTVVAWILAMQWRAYAAARRRQHATFAPATREQTTPEQMLAQLRSHLPDLSAEQQQEARALSGIVRQECGRRLGISMQSATEQQLLQRMQVLDPKSPIDDSQRALVDVLHFVGGILFAGARPSAEVWKAQLREVERWLERGPGSGRSEVHP